MAGVHTGHRASTRNDRWQAERSVGFLKLVQDTPRELRFDQAASSCVDASDRRYGAAAGQNEKELGRDRYPSSTSLEGTPVP